MLRERGQLTDDVHLAEVQADFGEGGDASSGVVSPTVAVFSSGAVGRTLGGVIEPGKHTCTGCLSSALRFRGISSFTEKIAVPGVRWSFVMKQAVLIVILLFT